jgi:hypothetical protein
VSERRATTLTAQGGTACEIGQALFVTPKTVEVHLSNVYRKQRLRVRRRKPHDDGERGGGQDRHRLNELRFLALRLSGPGTRASPGSGRRAGSYGRRRCANRRPMPAIPLSGRVIRQLRDPS